MNTRIAAQYRCWVPECIAAGETVPGRDRGEGDRRAWPCRRRHAATGANLAMCRAERDGINLPLLRCAAALSRAAWTHGVLYHSGDSSRRKFEAPLPQNYILHEPGVRSDLINSLTLRGAMTTPPNNLRAAAIAWESSYTYRYQFDQPWSAPQHHGQAQLTGQNGAANMQRAPELT